MTEYWSVRMRDAQAKAQRSANGDVREIYHQLADHYRSMSKLSPLVRDKRQIGTDETCVGADKAIAKSVLMIVSSLNHPSTVKIP